MRLRSANEFETIAIMTAMYHAENFEMVRNFRRRDGRQRVSVGRQPAWAGGRPTTGRANLGEHGSREGKPLRDGQRPAARLPPEADLPLHAATVIAVATV
jgi:hypothetical protein